MNRPRIAAALAFTALAPAALVLGVALADPALAQSKSERAVIFQKLADCRKVTDNTARLACFDQAAAALDQAEAKGDVVVLDREQARNVRKQAFGFQLPSISIFAKGEAKEDVDSYEGVIAASRRDASGRWTLRLEDGAVWSQVTPEELFKTPKAGSKVRIRKGALGSFILSIDGQGGFKAHRVQ